MSKYDDGLRQANDLIRRSPGQVVYWLERAQKGRRRWRTRLFLPRKRQFLNGFVAGLELYVQGRAGEPLPDLAASMPAGPTPDSTDEMMIQALAPPPPAVPGAIPKPAQ